MLPTKSYGSAVMVSLIFLLQFNSILDLTVVQLQLGGGARRAVNVIQSGQTR